LDIRKRNNVHVIDALRPDAPVLLYAHGFGCSQHMWRHITPAFQGKYRQVLFDYVGSGQSDLAAFDHLKYASLQGYVQDVLDVCDALGIEHGVHFVGHSVSASIGLLAAIERPALFDRLVLVGPSPCFINYPPDYLGGFEHQDLEDLLDLMDQNFMGWSSSFAPVVAGAPQAGSLVDELSDSFCSTDPMTARIFAQATFFADIREAAQHVTRPCLILQHCNDALAPLAVGEFLHEQLRGSTLEVLDVAGHCAHMSHPHLVTAAMQRYLSPT
jgi:sigma-B regulation protein RsbQ